MTRMTRNLHGAFSANSKLMKECFVNMHGAMMIYQGGLMRLLSVTATCETRNLIDRSNHRVIVDGVFG